MPRLAVLGYPVGHSRSPAMQNAALAALGMDDEWIYGAIEVAPEEFEALVRSMPQRGIRRRQRDDPAQGSGAGDRRHRQPQSGRDRRCEHAAASPPSGIHAENTDAGAVIASLPGPPQGQRALVLGAGGAARAAVWALGSAGAAVDLWNRTPARAEGVRIEISERAQELQVEIELQTVPQPAEELDQRGYELIVNTTAVGLQGEDPFAHLPLRRDGFHPGQLVIDMVYGDEPSTLLAAAVAAGARTVDGIEILVLQGALSFELWTGRKPPLDVMRAAARGA